MHAQKEKKKQKEVYYIQIFALSLLPSRIRINHMNLSYRFNVFFHISEFNAMVVAHTHAKVTGFFLVFVLILVGSLFHWNSEERKEKKTSGEVQTPKISFIKAAFFKRTVFRFWF